jgi:hypothetical protein
MGISHFLFLLQMHERTKNLYTCTWRGFDDQTQADGQVILKKPNPDFKVMQLIPNVFPY